MKKLEAYRQQCIGLIVYRPIILGLGLLFGDGYFFVISLIIFIPLLLIIPFWIALSYIR